MSLAPLEGFDYLTANEAEILEAAGRLEGCRLGDIPSSAFVATTGATGRGEVGGALETYFGIPSNSRREADFPGAGIELKVVPLIRTGKGLRVKERTVITMVDYFSLPQERWATAHIRDKLNILFVFFEHLPDQPKALFPIRHVLLWNPEGEEEAVIRADWERVQKEVVQGRAHLLSEGDGVLLGPCTKSSDSTKRRKQAVLGAPSAKPRAFALKPSFTGYLYAKAIGALVDAEYLSAQLGVSGEAALETALIGRTAPYVGRRVSDIAMELGVPESDGKSYAASVVHRIFGVRSFRTKVEEFERAGLTLRVSRVDGDLMPYEALSFPAFRYAQLLEEEWESSRLLADAGFILFLPLEGLTKGTAQANCIFREPVFWRPDHEQLETMHAEWEMFRQEIANGKAKELTPASETKILHVRPHARDGSDTDEAPLVGPVVKKSFWFNPQFVQEILRGA